jgi:hypothetical protein
MGQSLVEWVLPSVCKIKKLVRARAKLVYRAISGGGSDVGVVLKFK